MERAITNCMISTYAADTCIEKIPCNKDNIDKIIFAKAWKKVKEQEEAIP